MRYSRLFLTLKYIRFNSHCHLGIVFLGASLLLLFLFGKHWSQAQLWLFGETTPGVVKQKTTVAVQRPLEARVILGHGGRRRNDSRFYLDYVFEVDNRVFAGRQGVSHGFYNQVRVGQPLNVVFLPGRPEVNGVKDHGPRGPLQLVLAVLGPLLALAGATCLLFGFRNARARARLIEEGTPALGLIEAVETDKTSKGKVYVRQVRFSYLVAAGGKREILVGTMDRNIPYDHGEVRQGDVVLAAYDPAQPDRVEVDCFDARREERLVLEATVGPS